MKKIIALLSAIVLPSMLLAQSSKVMVEEKKIVDKMVIASNIIGNSMPSSDEFFEATDNYLELSGELVKLMRKYPEEGFRHAFSYLQKKLGIDIYSSSDGKLRIFTEDIMTGGTAQEYNNIVQFRTNSGKVITIHNQEFADGDNTGGNIDEDLEEIVFERITGIDMVTASDGKKIYLVNTYIKDVWPQYAFSLYALTISGDKLVKTPVIKLKGRAKSDYKLDYSFDVTKPGRFNSNSKSFPQKNWFYVLDKKTQSLYVAQSGNNRYDVYQFNGKFFTFSKGNQTGFWSNGR